MKMEFPLLLDGGLSNVLESRGCDLNHHLWTARLLAENPQAIEDVHYEYLNAGAECIITSSYQCTVGGFVSLGYDLDAAEKLISLSVQLAESARNRFLADYPDRKKPLIAASIGPYGAYLGDGSEYRGDYKITEAELTEFHKDRLELLDQSHADLFACETIPSFAEAKVLAELLRESSKPAWISFSCKDGEHINDGTPIQECVAQFENHPTVFAVGVNCTHPKFISGLIKSIKNSSNDLKVIVYPNSGEVYIPDSKTWIGLDDPNSFAQLASEWISLGADIIGGCCRIGPSHILELQKVLAVNQGDQ